MWGEMWDTSFSHCWGCQDPGSAAECSQHPMWNAVCTWKGEEVFGYDPVCLAVCRMDGIMWNQMHFANNGNIYAVVEEDFLLISITPWPFWLGNSLDSQMCWDPYILSIGLGTVCTLGCSEVPKSSRHIMRLAYFGGVFFQWENPEFQ